MNKPHTPRSSGPSRDDDPTGVHALLSSLPHPDPMPKHLVERINASLAAEQAQRAAGMESDQVSPMITRTPRRQARLVFAVAGAAAAVVLVAAVSNINFSGSQTTETSIGAAIASTSSSRDQAGEAAQNDDAHAPAPVDGRLSSEAQSAKASPRAASRGELPGVEALYGLSAAPDAAALQILQSGTRYTQADFQAQAVTLHQLALTRAHLRSAASVGPTSTTDWLRECMSAIGASQVQVIEADVAFYQGRPAVIIVGMANGTPLAYVVAPECSHADPAILRPATSLP